MPAGPAGEGPAALEVALVHAHAWPEVRRGGERYVHDLAWYLASRGHRVELITGTLEAPSVDTADGIVHRRVRNRPGPVARRLGAGATETIGLRALRPMLHRFDVVHALTESAAVAAKLAGHRTVYTNLGLPDREWLRSQPRAWRWFRTATRLADVSTAVSAAAADRLAEVSGRPAVALHAGIRTDAFALDAAPRSGPPRILFASARDQGSKGLDVLLEALPRVLDRHPDARLVLAGPGDGSWAFAHLGSVLERVRSAIDDVGTDVSMPDLYRSSTVTALPSSNEALGLVLLESLACGTPVVAGQHGGPVEIVSDPAVGRLVPLRNPPALARALCEAIDLARAPGTAARCAAHARRWDWAGAVGPEHEAVYLSALRRSGRR